MIRPDFSDYVAHFTKDSDPFGKREHPTDPLLQSIKGSAFERLQSILKSQVVHATPMPWTNKLAVAFTECPWWSLIDHALRYSPYAVGFRKETLFASGGGPAIYLRPDLHDKQQTYASTEHPQLKGFHPELYAFVTPFAPPYSSSSLRGKLHGKIIDYSHEREWRVPGQFKFVPSQVEFVIVQTYKDMAVLERSLKDQIGRDRFLIMDVYRQVERLWPTHLVGGKGK